MVLDGGSAEVETEGEVLAEVEFLSDTGAESDNLIVCVLPLEVVVVAVFGALCKRPVVGTTGIEVCVVDTVGLIAAPPVGEVDHHVEARADVVHLGLLVAIDGVFPGLSTDSVHFIFVETLHRKEVSAQTGSDDGAEPFAHIERSCGSEAVAELTVLVLVGKADGHTAFSLNEPVVLKLVQKHTLRGILGVGHFLSILSHGSSSGHCQAQC